LQSHNRGRFDTGIIMTTSLQHKRAQMRISNILGSFYEVIGIEVFTPTPNEKYVYDGEEFEVKPYLLDVYAQMPICPDFPRQLGVEIDGKKGHKTSKHQTIRDEQRTKDIQKSFPDLKLFRFDTKDLIGRGYVNPKTKKRHPILTDNEITAELGLKCTHL